MWGSTHIGKFYHKNFPIKQRAVRNLANQQVPLHQRRQFVWRTWAYDSRFAWTGRSVVAHACFPQGTAAQCPVGRRNTWSRPHLPALPTCERTHTPLWPLLRRRVTWGARWRGREHGSFFFTLNYPSGRYMNPPFLFVRPKRAAQEEDRILAHDFMPKKEADKGWLH